MNGAAAIVLAAGKSTRMKSAVPKVLHDVCGRPMIDYVLDAARDAGADRLVVVVGHQADRVQDALAHHDDVEFALQAEQLGTGHAVMVCREALAGHDGPVLVLAGDTPLLKGASLAALLDARRENDAACVIGTAETDANEGLGRVVRDADGHFRKIVEQKDATPDELAIREINTGCYVFDGRALFAALDQIRPDNRQAEYYLTDCPAILQSEGQTVVASPTLDIREAMGINTRVQLAEVARAIQQDVLETLMRAGVTIVDPRQTWIDPRARIGADTVIHPFTAITGPAVIGGNCRIGPHAVIRAGADLPDGTTVAPFETVPPER